MSDRWTFHLAPPAQDYVSQLETARRAELIEQVDALSERPMELMTRSVLGGLDIWKFEYRSSVVPEMLVTVWLSKIQSEQRRVLIEFITDAMTPDALG